MCVIVKDENFFNLHIHYFILYIKQLTMIKTLLIAIINSNQSVNSNSL